MIILFKTIYVLKLHNKKYLNSLIKYHVGFYKIKEQDDAYFLYVNKDDYEKIKKYFEVYGITLERIYGYQKYINMISEKRIFIITLIMGIIYLYLLSNIIFDVKIISNNEEIVILLKDELERYGIRKYYIHVLERIINNENKEIKYQSVIAKKNAIILEIKSSSGQIIKKVNDYVNKGEVIISGFITKKDEIKNIVRAEGTIYGETWYNIKVELPHTYERKSYTGNFYKELSLSLFNKRVSLKKKKYDNSEYYDNILFSNKILPISLNYSTVYEVKKDYLIYDYGEALLVGMNKAKEKLLETLDKNSKILYQKKLKLYEENSKIVIEVFFKVYENITDYIEITGGSDERNN